MITLFSTNLFCRQTYYTDFFLDNKFVKHLQHHPEALTEIASSLINHLDGYDLVQTPYTQKASSVPSFWREKVTTKARRTALENSSIHTMVHC